MYTVIKKELYSCRRRFSRSIEKLFISGSVSGPDPYFQFGSELLVSGLILNSVMGFILHCLYVLRH